MKKKAKILGKILGGAIALPVEIEKETFNNLLIRDVAGDVICEVLNNETNLTGLNWAVARAIVRAINASTGPHGGLERREAHDDRGGGADLLAEARPLEMGGAGGEESMRLPVLNQRTDPIPKGALYVGRPSPLGNPFPIRGTSTRAVVIEKYRAYFLERVKRDLVFMAAVRNARTATALVCWCKPEPCHSDVIAEYLEANDFP